MSAPTSMSAAAAPNLPTEIHPAPSDELSLLDRASLKVGGLAAFTATDYPGKLAAVVFVRGCPWRCRYCHNPHLQARTAVSPMAWAQVLARLQRRVGLIDAVVFSGGEPTLDPALEEAIEQTRALGFGIGLHTSGAYPRRLAQVLPQVDWVAMDVKTSFQNYDAITRVADSGRHALNSAEIILTSGVPHEFRTTVHPALHAENEILSLAKTLSTMGVQNYALQVFRSIGCDDEKLNAVSTAGYPSADLVAQLSGLFPRFQLRRE